jgi:hypothetical protein
LLELLPNVVWFTRKFDSLNGFRGHGTGRACRWFLRMEKPRRYSLGVLFDTFWLVFALTAIWGSVLTVIGSCALK